MTWRPVAALAGALTIGAIVAVIPPELSLLAAVFAAALAFVAALAIAAVLLAVPVLARRRRPPASWIAIALAIGAILVFPVNASFTTEPDAEGSCDGVLPLGELVQNQLAGDSYAALYYVAGCEG